MFATIVDALQGGPDTDSEEEDEEPEERRHDADRQGGAAAQQQAAGSGAFNFWNMAASVADTVKQSAAEIATTVKTTDWRAELGAFGKDVMDETEELGQSAVAAVEQAIDNVEQLPQHAATALPVLEERRREVTTQLGQQLGRLGHGFVASTHDLFEQVKDAIQTELSDNPGGRPQRMQRAAVGRGCGSAAGTSKYSRLEAEVAAMQRDSGTYCDDPPDSDAYEAWLKNFDLEARRPDIEAIIADNTFMAELQSRIVPLIVDYSVFWTRYFYRLHLLREKHSQRQQLAQRAQQMAAEEVGWGDDEDDAASPTAAGPASAAPGPALAAAAAAALAAAAPKQASATTSQPEADLRPTDEHPAADADEVATASDSTDGAGAGERWTVVSSGTPTKASAAAATPVGASEAARPPDAAAVTEGGAEAPAAFSKAKAERSAAATVDAALRSPAKPAAPVAAAPPKAVADDSDDDLGDVDVPGDGGSDVDEDWGDISE